MSAPFSTIYLDVAAWDMTVDASGNIALAGPTYSLTQDVASACRTFKGEVYYDTTLGVPYLGQITDGTQPGTPLSSQLLGRTPPLNILQGALAAAALTVPSVTAAQCVISAFRNRQASGQVQFTTKTGTTLQVAI